MRLENGIGFGFGFWITTGGAENEIRRSGEDPVEELGWRSGRRRRWKLGDEIIEEIERRDGAQSPIENGHNPELHSLDCSRGEHEIWAEYLEVQKQWDMELLHFRRQRQARHR
jgi:hypothetical protein